MPKVVRVFIFTMLVGTLSACDGAVTSFVNGARPTKESPTITDEPAPVQPAANGIKITPGRLIATSADLQMEATVSVTRRRLSASDLNAEITLHRSPVDP